MWASLAMGFLGVLLVIGGFMGIVGVPKSNADVQNINDCFRSD